ncbi:MAG: hypothetical protein ACK40G_12840 [Cytophagaceae bacterium]
MTEIILISGITFIAGIILTWNIITMVIKKIKKQPINLKSQLIRISILIFVVGVLSVYNVYLITYKIIDNRDQILDYGQKAISASVDYGATAVFEGLGNTIDHFQDKWDAKYSEQLKNVDIEMQTFTLKHLDENNDTFIADIIFHNKNTDNEKLNLSHISDNNFMLIGNKDSIYYPIRINNNQYNNYLPEGNTVLKVEGILPKSFEVKFLRLHNAIKEIQ